MSKSRDLGEFPAAALDIDASGNVSVTGDVSLADNDKLILGDSSDLQIYHDGADSYIKDNGTGYLKLLGTGSVEIGHPSNGHNYIRANYGGDVELYFSNAEKLSTTSTGINVTGEVTADGLTVDGAGTTVLSSLVSLGDNTSYADLTFNSSDTSNGTINFADATDSNVGRIQYDHSDNSLLFRVNDAERLRIDNAGNIGIGTNTVTDYGGTALQIHASSGSAARIKLTNSTSGSTTSALGGSLTFDTSNVLSLLNRSEGAITLGTSNTERMRIDAYGAVGINYSNPSLLGTLTVGQTADGKGIAIADSTKTNTFFLENDGTQCNIRNNDAAPIVFSTNLAERMRIDSVGDLNLVNSGLANINFTTDGSSDYARIAGGKSGSGVGDLRFYTYSGGMAERVRIDSTGNLLVGTTSISPQDGTHGFVVRQNGYTIVSVDNARPMLINRATSDGDLLQFRKDGTTAGSIGTSSGIDLTIGNGDTGILFVDAADVIIPWNMTTNAKRDNVIDLGNGSNRFNDAYITNGVTAGSDRTLKQDILEITAAEYNVAKACKGLLRSFRWIDAVEKKGDDARIHFGIIAQDLQDAFTAEGLDAGRYAMFMSNTWWETQTEVAAVDAVEEVTNEDGNVTTEAVEAKDAYTRIETFETLAEAPAGATERTRLGVRYSELLAFIIAAI